MKYKLGGESFTLKQACRRFGMVSELEARARLNDGQSFEEAVLCISDDIRKETSQGFGLHFMLDGYGAPVETLNDLNEIFFLLNDFPAAVGMTKISQPHVFHYSGLVPEDYGVTGSVILAESHCSIHTFPGRDGHFFFDLFSCKVFDPYPVLNRLRNRLLFPRYEITLAIRGRKFKRQTCC